MAHVNNLDLRVKKVESAVLAVPEMVDAVMKTVHKGSADVEK